MGNHSVEILSTNPRTYQNLLSKGMQQPQSNLQATACPLTAGTLSMQALQNVSV